MNNYIDYKATVWFRIPIESEDDVTLVQNRLIQGDDPSDLYNELPEVLGPCEPLDTEEFMYPIENDNQPTMELYKNNELIWSNGKY